MLEIKTNAKRRIEKWHRPNQQTNQNRLLETWSHQQSATTCYHFENEARPKTKKKEEIKIKKKKYKQIHNRPVASSVKKTRYMITSFSMKSKNFQLNLIHVWLILLSRLRISSNKHALIYRTSSRYPSPLANVHCFFFVSISSFPFVVVVIFCRIFCYVKCICICLYADLVAILVLDFWFFRHFFRAIALIASTICYCSVRFFFYHSLLETANS